MGLFREMLSGISFNSKHTNLKKMNLNTPVLFISGAEDPVGESGKGVERAAASFRRAGARDVTVKLYPGLSPRDSPGGGSPSGLRRLVPVAFQQAAGGLTMVILETERLLLRELTAEDRPALCAILQDAEAMYAYAHAFSDREVDDWLQNQMTRYCRDGFGLWAAVRKSDGTLIGQCGLTWQQWEERQVLEVGYLFRRSAWHQGYAIEAAQACRDYAFSTLKAAEVFSIIRDNNWPSRRVAERNGMTIQGGFIKHYYGLDMPHLVYGVRRRDC